MSGTQDDDNPSSSTTLEKGVDGSSGHDTRSIGRIFSQTMRKTGASLKRSMEGCSVEDVSQIMDVQMLLESIPKDAVDDMVARDTLTVKDKVARGDARMKAQDKKAVRRDEVAFFVGVVNVALIGFWMGHSPETYYHYWTFKSIVLFSWRHYRAYSRSRGDSTKAQSSLLKNVLCLHMVRVRRVTVLGKLFLWRQSV